MTRLAFLAHELNFGESPTGLLANEQTNLKSNIVYSL